MKITKRQLRKMIKEEKRRLTESYNSMSSRGKALANAAKRRFAKDYPDVQVGIDGREGWITVNGRKAVNMSQASGSPLSMDDIIDRMKQAYLGHDMLSQEVEHLTPRRKSSWQVRKEKELAHKQLGESKVKITKDQLKRLIAEEKQKLINENSPIANARYMQGSYSNTSAIDAVEDAISRLLMGTDQDAMADFGDEDESDMAATAAVTLTVAETFQSLGLLAQYEALIRTLR